MAQKKAGQEELRKAFDMYTDGATQSEIAQELGVSPMAVSKWAAKYDWEGKMIKAQDQAENKIAKNKATRSVEEREDMIERHKGIAVWLTTELKMELLKRPDDIGEEKRKLIRMKCLEIAVKCYDKIMEQERKIYGADDSVDIDNQPDEIIYKIRTTAGDMIDEVQDIVSMLPPQDPHHYRKDGITAPTVIHMKAEDIKVIDENAPPEHEGDKPIEPIIDAHRAQSVTLTEDEMLEMEEDEEDDYGPETMGGRGFMAYGF